jgi:hypothetical protein
MVRCIYNLLFANREEYPHESQASRRGGCAEIVRLSKPTCADFRRRGRSRSQPLGSAWSNSAAKKLAATAWSGFERQPNISGLEEFLIHGLKYAFPAEHGEVTRGIPTSYAAEPLNSEIVASNDLPPVHSVDINAFTRAYSIVPLQTLDQRSGGPLNCG